MANGWIVKAIVIAAIGAAGTGIINNEVRNVKSHVDIRKESLEGDEKIVVKVEKVQETVNDIKVEQGKMMVYLESKL